MYEYDPSLLANEIYSIVRTKRPADAESVTLDISIDVGAVHQAFYRIYFLDSQKAELAYFGRDIMDDSETLFQTNSGELDIRQVNRLLNAISYRLTLTPERKNPRKPCITAHWEW